MNKEIQDYLDYVQNVLGGKTYIQNENDLIQEKRLKVLVLVPVKLNAAEDDLLGKILSAIDLKTGDFTVQTWDQGSDESAAENLFVFGEGYQSAHSNQFLFPTISQLLVEPELKKNVWNQIKHLKS